MKEIARIRNVDMPQSLQKQIDAAKSAIDERLKIWGTDCDGWLPKEVGLSTQDLFRRFYTYHVSRKSLCNIGLNGWECGLGQILDIRDERIACILPYLLTAYMYNFHSNKLITGFINNSCPSTWRPTWKDQYFFGIEPDNSLKPNDLIGDQQHQDSQESQKARRRPDMYGIGKYLTNGVVSLPSREKKMQEKIRNMFFFPDAALIEVSGYSTDVYLVPIEALTSFEHKIKHGSYIIHKDIDSSSATKTKEEADRLPEIEYEYLDANESPREYRIEFYHTAFLAWYQTACEAFYSKRKSKMLACEPYAKDSYSLLQYHLKEVALENIRCASVDQVKEVLCFPLVTKPSKQYEGKKQAGDDVFVLPPHSSHTKCRAHRKDKKHDEIILK